MDNPCRYCVPPKRQAGCRNTCENGPIYNNWLDERNAKKQEIYKAKLSENIFLGYCKEQASTLQKQIQRERVRKSYAGS